MYKIHLAPPRVKMSTSALVLQSTESQRLRFNILNFIRDILWPMAHVLLQVIFALILEQFRGFHPLGKV